MSKNATARTWTDWFCIGWGLLLCAAGLALAGYGVSKFFGGDDLFVPGLIYVLFGSISIAVGYFITRVVLSSDPDYSSPEEVERQSAFGWQERLYPVGPDIGTDIRLQRPYFLLCIAQRSGLKHHQGLPLDPSETADLAFTGEISRTAPELARALGRVKKWIIAQQQAGAGSITDVYVLSHGWRRNLYGSIAAYDRLISRLTLLNRRQRLPTPNPYNPLFLSIHWHSDPGENQWRDTSGRRSKAGFIQNVRSQFEGRDPDFQNDFEDLYALLAKMSEGVSLAEAEKRKPSDALQQSMLRVLAEFNDLRDDERNDLRAVLPLLRRLSDPLAEEAGHLLEKLSDPAKGYRLKHAPPRRPDNGWTAEETAAAWACYHETTPEPARLDQDKAPGRFLPRSQVFFGMLKLLLLGAAAASVFFVLFRGLPEALHTGDGHLRGRTSLEALLPNWMVAHFQDQARALVSNERGSVSSIILGIIAMLVSYGFNYALIPWRRFPKPRIDENKLGGLRDFEQEQQLQQQRHDRLVAPVILVLYAVALGYCGLLVVFFRPWWWSVITLPSLCAALYLSGGAIAQKVRSIEPIEDQPESPHKWYQRLVEFPIAIFSVLSLQIAAWAFIQFLLSLPLLFFAGTTWALSPLVRWHNSSEKCSGGEISIGLRRLRPTFLLSATASLPIRLARKALPIDSRFHKVLDNVEAQLAFWEMQQRAAVTGVVAAQALARLAVSTPGLESSRIHFLGHSFGGVVAANAAKEFAIEKLRASDANTRLDATIESLTLVLPAMASDWFENEEYLRNAVHGVIACIYSRYDTANGFYYPLANYGRLSAGFVGLFGGKEFRSSVKRELVSLVKPPDLSLDSDKGNSQTSTNEFPRIISLDLSRICCDGPPVSGGGHGDIFKDDVLHVVWAVTTARSIQ